MSGRAEGRMVLALGLILLGCGGAPSAPSRVVVRDAFAFEAARGGTAAGYAVIWNGTDSTEVLDSVTSTVATTVTAHGTRQDGGLVTMIPMEHPAILGRDSLAFQPGGAHLMLEGLTTDLRDGERLVLVFWFHRAGRIPVDAMVRAYGS